MWTGRKCCAVVCIECIFCWKTKLYIFWGGSYIFIFWFFICCLFVGVVRLGGMASLDIILFTVHSFARKQTEKPQLLNTQTRAQFVISSIAHRSMQSITNRRIDQQYELRLYTRSSTTHGVWIPSLYTLQAYSWSCAHLYGENTTSLSGTALGIFLIDYHSVSKSLNVRGHNARIVCVTLRQSR